MDENDFEIQTRKLSWHNAITLTIFWLTIYVGIALPQGNRLPQAQTIYNEVELTDDAFIAERAKNALRAITNVGARMVGSYANEFVTIEVLKAEMEHIKSELRQHLKLEFDVQIASGNFSLNNTVFVYRSIQNFVVKLSSAKSSATRDCLLLNSHFDTVPQSPGAGDDASMVAVMLEVLRVLAKSHRPMKHSVVFLFNGAEETGWMGAHAFVTQHKWAKDCRVFINLDAAGWGGKLMLFQMAPDQEWLMQHYRNVPHPFATSFGEEIFQSGLMLSDTDFRVLRKFGNMSGFDLALISNSYVYHTKFDRYDGYPTTSLQHAGDNVLAMTRSLLNGLDNFDDEQHQIKEKLVYYDFFGYSLMLYPASFGFLLNISVCIIAGVAISLSVFEFSVSAGLGFVEVLMQFGTTMMMQIFSLLLGASMAILVAAFLYNFHCSLSWYSNKWLLLGLYFCPIFFGMLIVPALTLKHIDYKGFCLMHKIKLLMHAHCVWLMLITFLLTICEVRSAYLGMIAIAFYGLAVWTNLSAEWRGGGYDFWFLVPVILSQILPFTIFTSLTHTIYAFVVPLMGRSGMKFKSELLMAGIAVLMSSLFAGFIMPIFLTFQKTVKIAGIFLLINIFSIFVAFTSLGFPFIAESAVQRFNVYHEHRIMHNRGTGTSENVCIRVKIFDQSIRNINDFSELFSTNEEFSEAIDLARTFYLNGELNFCIPIVETPAIAESQYPKLEVLHVAELSESPTRKRFHFRLTGPLYMNATLMLYNTKIVDWSFAKDDRVEDGNQDGIKWDFPLYFKLVSARNNGPYEFHITFERTKYNKNSKKESYFEIGVYGQWHNEQQNYVSKFRRFIDAFPNYAFVYDYLATYENWSFDI